MKAACRLLPFILIFGLALTSAPSVAQQLIDTIPVGSTPTSAALNLEANQIYVANMCGNDPSCQTYAGTVSVIDGTTYVTKTVAVGSQPRSLALNPVTNQIYVTNVCGNDPSCKTDAGTVSVIDGSSNSVMATVPVGNYPYSLAVNPVTNQIYVGNLGSNSVSVIDGSSNSIIKTIGVGSGPYSIAVNPVTNPIYVANVSSNNVSVIDGSSNSVIKTVAVGNGPQFLAVNPIANQIYVANKCGNDPSCQTFAGTVSVLNGSNNSVIATVAVGSYADSLAVNPVTNQIYVANACGNDPSCKTDAGTVSVVDGSSNSVIATVAVGNYPDSLAVNPVTNRIYVANEGSTVSVIDGSNKLVATITVGGGPNSIAVNPVTNKVYVPNGNNVSIIAGANASALQFVAVTPCRLVDTRNGKSPIQGGTSRTFHIPQLGGCGIPSTAAAYSLNVTVVPSGPLGYLTIWPTGEDQPPVSTMNSVDGRVKANAAIVPAGYQGAVSVYVTNTTNVVLDINGYFAPVSSSTLAFYPLTPCRVADTRNPKSALGGPSLLGLQERDFPILEATACKIPNTAQAYSLNFTAVPHQPLGYLTTWAAGKPQPNVSTLNSPTGTVVANAAIVPADANGAIAVFVTNPTDLVIDINGYFAPAEQGGLSLYPSAPCRVLDTRQTGGLFSGTLGSDVADSVCEPPETAQAYVLNATVVPKGPLGYLTLWPNGEQQPGVSTLNAIDGAITSNMAIVPTINSRIDAYATNLTQLVLDISSYFAP